MDSRSGMLQGSSCGRAIQPGQPDNSLCLKVIHHEIEDLKMPAEGERLPARVIAEMEK